MEKKTLKDIEAQEGTIKAKIIKDADGDVNYIKDIAGHGCVSGICRGLVYYVDTHKFFLKYANEIDELLEDYWQNVGQNAMFGLKEGDDLRNYLAWWAYEYAASKILDELEEEI